MVLKRKRSDSELSSFSGSSAFSSPARPGSSGFFDFSSMTVNTSSLSINAQLRTPSHLPSRTMKRFRDSRPSAEEVHQHTLSLLYSAPSRPLTHSHDQGNNNLSRRLFQAPSTPLPPAPAAQSNPPANSTSQRSLHSFWNLPSPTPASAPADSSSSLLSLPTHCEDCGVGLGNAVDADGDDAMDLDGCGLTAGEVCCGACGKAVCFSCSISDLGEQRRCLVCAGRKVSAAGIGWTNGVGVTVL